MSNYIMDDSSAHKERSLKEWREIFTISTRKSGLNISEYLGAAKVVYISDTMGKTEVGSISKEAFPKDVIVLCSKKLFAKLAQENKDATVCAFLSDTSLFTEDEKEYLTAVFKKDPARYLEQVIMSEDQIALAEGLKLCASKKWLDECFSMTERLGKTNMNFVLLDFSSKSIEKPAPKRKKPSPAQNDAAAGAISIKEARKTFKLSVGEDGIAIIGYKGDSADVVIPEQIAEHKVIEIRRAAFENNEIIKSATLPQTIVKIGESAFHCCKNLIKINIPDSVESIGTYAFRGCEKLRDITLPKKIRKVGESAFSGCPGLADENGFTIYKDCLYGYFGKDTVVILPNGIKQIEGAAFWRNDKLEEIILPESLKSIKYKAFLGCTSLKQINLPAELKTIGEYAFYDCLSLTSIEIPQNVKKLEPGVFSGCINLEHVKLGLGTTEISKQEVACFFACDKLTLHAPAGSYAERYAKENGIRFSALKE